MMGKFNRLLRKFRTKYGSANVNISGLEGNFSREDELLLRIHNDKVAYEEQKVLDKRASNELQEKNRQQDLTHGLEAGTKHRHDILQGEDEVDDEALLDENNDNCT